MSVGVPLDFFGHATQMPPSLAAAGVYHDEHGIVDDAKLLRQRRTRVSGGHVVAIASMMLTFVACRAGRIAAMTPTKNATTRMTMVLRTGTVNTVTP